jgi:hypothetical protein
VFTKEILVCQTFFNITFNGVLKFAGTVKIRGFETFSRCISREGGYRFSYGSTLKLSGRRHITYIRLRDIASVIRNQL